MSETLYDTKPKVVLRLDYLFLGKFEGDNKCVFLVVHNLSD